MADKLTRVAGVAGRLAGKLTRSAAWILIVIAAIGVGTLIQMNRFEYLVLNLESSPYLVKIDHLTGQQCLASLPVGLSRRLFLKESDISPC